MSSAAPPGSDKASIGAGCRLLGIPLDPTWMDAVASNLHVLSRHTEVLLSPALPDDLDPAPVFTA